MTEQRHDAIWVVVDRLPKSAYFTLFCATYSRKILEKLSRSHGNEIDLQHRLSSLNIWTICESIQILEDMLRACVLDLGGNWKKYLHLAEFAYNNSYQASIGMAPFEALVSPRKGITRFGVKGKLTPRYVRPFQITQRVGVVAYRLDLPPKLSHVHNVFHVSMLRKCQADPNAIVQWYSMSIQDDMTYEEAPIQILDRKMKSLHQREIPLVKVLWQHHDVEEAT
ncbi:uncharacterized protein LOC112091124 [Morus notabilis]|uniref:uncharacterized protein LOC112091124 n=1 Tax=Morus notabilis TaxID=981085 RepID=UPI000CED0F4E|nr:uncharacterized protein LOC112091124 [Morus notabilis]